MKPEQKNEILCLYIGYFVTLAFGLIPALSWYAVGALALQLFYAIIRYVGTTETIFRSHAFNYILAVGASFAVGLLFTIQAQAIGGEVLSTLVALASGSRPGPSSFASSFGYIFFMMALEGIFAIFWPIVLIARGLHLTVQPGRRVSFGSRGAGSLQTSSQGASRRANTTARFETRKWLASAVLTAGQVVKFDLDDNPRPRVIGRNKDEVDIVVSDATVSRRHARIEIERRVPLDQRSGIYQRNRRERAQRWFQSRSVAGRRSSSARRSDIYHFRGLIGSEPCVVNQFGTFGDCAWACH